MSFERLLQRRVALSMLFLGLCLVGGIAAFRLPVELMPESGRRTLTIFTSVRGGMPSEEVERLVTIPIEETVSHVSHLTGLLSHSEESRSTVQLTFTPEASLDTATAEAREALSRIRQQLPREIEKPIVARFREEDTPVLILTVTAPHQSTEAIRSLVDREIQPQLARLEGIARVEVAGGREEKILVELDEGRLRAHMLSATTIAGILGVSHLNLQAGGIAEASETSRVRMLGEFRSVEDLQQVGVARTVEGSILRLRDLAEVRHGYLEPHTLSRLNGAPIVACYVQKESQANTLHVAAAIARLLQHLQRDYPTLTFQLLNNQAESIRDALANVRGSLLWGALLAILILYAFLQDWRLTGLIALAMPISTLIACAGLWLSGLSLNVMTLSGLALGIGMLVDNAIVVMDGIHQRQRQGLAPLPAAAAGTRALAQAMVASTLTTIAVFVPLLFVRKELQTQYGHLGLAVTYALVASLAVALTWLPMLTTLGRGTTLTAMHDPSWLVQLTARYRRWLTQALAHRSQVVRWTGIAFLVAVFLAARLSVDVASPTQARTLLLHVEMASGTQLAITEQAVAQVEGLLRRQRVVQTVTAQIEPDSAKVYVTLKPSFFFSIKRFKERLRPQLNAAVHAFGEEDFTYFEAGNSFGKKELTLDLAGPEYPVLLDLAKQLATPLTQTKRFTDARLRYRPGRPEWRIVVDQERASQFGLTTAAIAEQLHAKLRGLRATLFYQAGKELEVVTRLRLEDRETIEQIQRLSLVTPTGALLPLAQVASFVEGKGPSEIWRQDKQRLIQLTAAVRRGSLGQAAHTVERILKHVTIPDGYTVRISDEYEQLVGQRGELLRACLLMVLLMYLILASLYESYSLPLLILVTIPLALIGVVCTLWFVRQPWTLGALAGCLMLGGIVVNNGILLLEVIEQYRQQGMALTQAIQQTAQERLRPILMTVSTTVLGLVPLLISTGEAAALWQPLALTVIAGLSASTLLTLFVLPCLVSTMNSPQDWSLPRLVAMWKLRRVVSS